MDKTINFSLLHMLDLFFDDIVTSGGRSSLDSLCMMFGSVACFPCLWSSQPQKKAPCFWHFFLNSTLTTKVNLWVIHCDISGGIVLGSYCFFRVSAFFFQWTLPLFSRKHELISLIRSYETNFVPEAYRKYS